MVKETGVESDTKYMIVSDIENMASNLYEKIIEEEEWNMGLNNEY